MSLNIEDVRDFLRDYVGENYLNDAQDFSNERIQKAIKFVVADFNETPVFSAYGVQSFPFIDTLLYGVAAWLLDGLVLSQTRNHLTYSTGGITVDDSDSGPEFSAIAARFKQMYEDKKRQIKNQLNLDQGWGQVFSEYYTGRSW